MDTKEQIIPESSEDVFGVPSPKEPPSPVFPKKVAGTRSTPELRGPQKRWVGRIAVNQSLLCSSLWTGPAQGRGACSIICWEGIDHCVESLQPCIVFI